MTCCARALLVLFLVAGGLSVMAGDALPPPALRVVCSWTHTGSEAGITEAVQQAWDLGFNAFAWTSSRNDELLVRLCRERGMQAWKVIEPLKARKEAVMQGMDEGEELLPGAIPVPEGHPFQYGGEPASGYREVLDKKMVCPLDPGVMAYTLTCVRKAADQGYDGVCWDFIGYRNYRCCRCPLCSAGLAAFKLRSPVLDAEEAEFQFYTDSLVHLYDALYDAVRAEVPDMKVMCHLHPVYLPDPFIGHLIKIDYCGITVSWFFRPHWDMAKVRDYTSCTVNGPYVHPGAVGMPMIGFYGEAERRDGARLAAELACIAASGAPAVMVCELGNILRDPEAAQAFRTAFLGK